MNGYPIEHSKNRFFVWELGITEVFLDNNPEQALIVLMILYPFKPMLEILGESSCMLVPVQPFQALVG